jgi:hypothetical protein
VLARNPPRWRGTTIGWSVISGAWFELDALYVVAAADREIALVNLVQRAFPAVIVRSASFTPDVGFTVAGDGVSHLTTSLNRSTGNARLQPNDALVAIWSLTPGQLGGTTVGFFDGANGLCVNPRNPTDQAHVVEIRLVGRKRCVGHCSQTRRVV